MEKASDADRNKRQLQEWRKAEPWLRERLWEWDFLGISENRGRAEDEYDCLIPGLHSRLIRAQGHSELVRFVSVELVSHWGLSPEERGTSGTSISRFVDGLVARWELDQSG